MSPRAVAAAIVGAAGCIGLACPARRSRKRRRPDAAVVSTAAAPACTLPPTSARAPSASRSRPSSAPSFSTIATCRPKPSFRLWSWTTRRRTTIGASSSGQATSDCSTKRSSPAPNSRDFSTSRLRWDRIPHTFSTRRPVAARRGQSGRLTLPSPRPDTAAMNRAPFIDPIRSMWDPVKLAIGVTPSKQWDFKAEYTRIGKSGDRPMGQAFGGSGNNASEILEPIDQTLHDLKLSQSYAQERFQFVATYDLSMFHNGIKSVTSDNPLDATDTPAAGAARGTDGAGTGQPGEHRRCQRGTEPWISHARHGERRDVLVAPERRLRARHDQYPRSSTRASLSYRLPSAEAPPRPTSPAR